MDGKPITGQHSHPAWTFVSVSGHRQVWQRDHPAGLALPVEYLIIDVSVSSHAEVRTAGEALRGAA